MSRFLRRSLRSVEPYVPGEQPRGDELIKLNTNENPYPPAPGVFRVLSQLGPDRLRRYPDPRATRLREAAADAFGCKPENVLAGNGSDELLRLALTAFVEPGDPVVTPDVTYSLYETLIAIHGAEHRTLALRDDFHYPEPPTAATGSLMFLCHPNAPTGLAAQPDLVRRVADGFPGMLVIDEAYADFADHDFLELATSRDDVLVVRTLSKSYSLAGMRIGLAVGASDRIDELMAVKDSYNLSAADQAAGVEAIRDRNHHAANVAKIKATRARLASGLARLGLEPLESAANFVFVRFPTAATATTAFDTLREAGVLVRYFSRPRIDDALRISVGTDEQIDRVLTCLGQVASG